MSALTKSLPLSQSDEHDAAAAPARLIRRPIVHFDPDSHEAWQEYMRTHPHRTEANPALAEANVDNGSPVNGAGILFIVIPVIAGVAYLIVYGGDALLTFLFGG